MSSVRIEERRPAQGPFPDRKPRTALEAARQRIDELEADLAYARKKSKRTSKAISKVYERGGIVRRTDRDGFTQRVIVTGEPQKDKIDPNSLRGRFVTHVSRHI